MLPGKYPRNVPWSEYCQEHCDPPDAHTSNAQSACVCVADTRAYRARERRRTTPRSLSHRSRKPANAR
eukprot:4183806-Prymnesium_polylepis.1